MSYAPLKLEPTPDDDYEVPKKPEPLSVEAVDKFFDGLRKDFGIPKDIKEVSYRQRLQRCIVDLDIIIECMNQDCSKQPGKLIETVLRGVSDFCQDVLTDYTFADRLRQLARKLDGLHIQITKQARYAATLAERWALVEVTRHNPQGLLKNPFDIFGSTHCVFQTLEEAVARKKELEVERKKRGVGAKGTYKPEYVLWHITDGVADKVADGTIVINSIGPNLGPGGLILRES
jgi:hypothetical protein